MIYFGFGLLVAMTLCGLALLVQIKLWSIHNIGLALGAAALVGFGWTQPYSSTLFDAFAPVIFGLLTVFTGVILAAAEYQLFVDDRYMKRVRQRADELREKHGSQQRAIDAARAEEVAAAEPDKIFWKAVAKELEGAFDPIGQSSGSGNKRRTA